MDRSSVATPGRSLWQWDTLPATIDQRYVDYARANASIGINGAAPNSVNANARVLSAEYLPKVAALANVWRPYGVRMYLSANFAAPVRLGGLKTADPLDQGVAQWWKAKAAEIYALIPDFGGFVVKANSEGQPGPKDYGRNHAQGANVLADAVADRGGHVIWRAFIYDEDVDPDRAKRAYIEFTRLDGQFRPNVLVQIKNGAIDFQPREPFHPLFGALQQTSTLAEIQATQEYLGQGKHLVYLGTMWQEFLESDTYAKGKGSTVAKVIAGEVQPQRMTGIASVVNPGLDRNWCGHHFSQSNWYASGRLAWNPELSADQIAEEWIALDVHERRERGQDTARHDDGFARSVRELHDATGTASSHRRRSLRPDAVERQVAASRLDGHLLPSGGGRRRRVRSDDERKQGRRAIFPARPGYVRQSRDVSGRVPAVVPSLRVDLPNEIREIAVAGALRKVPPRREAGGSHAGDLADRSQRTSIRSGTEKLRIASSSRSETQPRGATRS